MAAWARCGGPRTRSSTAPSPSRCSRRRHSGNETFLKRFRNEAKNAAGLTHPNIAQVFDYGDHDGIAYLVMELVEGEPLSTILERERTISRRGVVRILNETSKGLAAAHDAGVMHRDIKPGNLLIFGDDHVKITDFGVSRGTGQTTLTATGMVMGTAQYLAPELALGKPATPASDIYALGIIAYEAVVGRRPFTAANAVDIAIAQVNDPVPPLPDAVSPGMRDSSWCCSKRTPASGPTPRRLWTKCWVPCTCPTLCRLPLAPAACRARAKATDAAKHRPARVPREARCAALTIVSAGNATMMPGYGPVGPAEGRQMSDDAKILAGRYEVGDLIGRGGMAEVHIGYDTRLGRTVAIKILRADLARDPTFQTRFRREAQSAAGLNHPSIVAVYDTGEDTVVSSTGVPQAMPFIVMEYVEGHTVRDILKGDVAAPIDEAVEIVAGVLAALDYSHHAGLVHRDIKPANVMLTPTGAVKVMDFGIARALADAGQTMTQTQAVVGTAQYLSPEQARGENVDARSDLYSTGCLLFELLTGRPPFIGDSPVSVAYQHVREAAPRPSQFASDVPPELDQIVLRALAKDRNERYSSAGEFLADLRAFSSGDPVDPSTGAIGVGAAALMGGAAGLGAAALMGGDGTDQPTQAMPPVVETGATEIMPAQSPWATVAPAGAGAAAPVIVAQPLDPTLLDDDDLDRKGKNRSYWLLGGAIVAALLVILAIFMFTRGGGADPDPSATAIPIVDMTGFTQAEAQAALDKLGLVADFQEEPSDTQDKDLVTRTDPAAGETVAAGATVTVYLSTGPAEVTIPDVANMTQEAAIAALTEAGLVVQRVDSDDTHPEIAKDLATGTDTARRDSRRERRCRGVAHRERSSGPARCHRHYRGRQRARRSGTLAYRSRPNGSRPASTQTARSTSRARPLAALMLAPPSPSPLPRRLPLHRCPMSLASRKRTQRPRSLTRASR